MGKDSPLPNTHTGSPKEFRRTRSTPVAYTFGYWGWGTNTKRLVKLAAEWEEKAGRREPLWVDIRWKRSVRAPGFRGATFARATGAGLYTWMQGLGNSAIGTGKMKIANPKDSSLLLDTILEAHEARRRVIFFCACGLIRVKHRVTCHRARVANLLVAAARRCGKDLTVAEWPGGEPEVHTFEADDRNLRQWDGWVIPKSEVHGKAPLLVPQGTAFRLTGRTEERIALLHTPIYADRWKYRLIWSLLPSLDEDALERKQKSVRSGYGLEPLEAFPSVRRP
ncbi:MAG: hypothetical protein ABJA82_00975 [Myxococcales bacterium]